MLRLETKYRFVRQIAALPLAKNALFFCHRTQFSASSAHRVAAPSTGFFHDSLRVPMH
ncbi:hypothetical protein PT2222_30163 [Paraburkholderia tropica]